MLDKIPVFPEMSKKELDTEMEQLQIKLGQLQRQMKELKIPVILVFEGWDAAGKGTAINQVLQAMDPRGVNVFEIKGRDEEENLRPVFWKYWRKLPAKGRTAIFDRGWYQELFGGKKGSPSGKKIRAGIHDNINGFEKLLMDDGNVIIKIFLHISKKEQKKRFELLEKNDATAWRVKEEDWKHHKQYEDFYVAFDEMLEKTGVNGAPWTVIPTEDGDKAQLAIFKAVVDALEKRAGEAQEGTGKKAHGAARKPIAASKLPSVLDTIDLSKTMTQKEYKEKLKKYQSRIRDIEYAMYKKRIPLMILYEGWDAAGKGGNIRRLTQHLDPRGYEVVPVAAPNDVERSHHYLWRFWNAIPKAGHITIFDRTWYGRVLVERVEGFCSEEDWRRAYQEINDMEKQLVDAGGVLVKFWLHIDKDEQLRRFEERQRLEYKNWKITDEDWRNREKWDAYRGAVDDMLFRTSTEYAPWTVVESNSKYYARIKALKTVIDAMEKRLEL